MDGVKVSFARNTTRSSKRNLAAIERIVASKYQRGAAFNRQHPFVDVLFSDITESAGVLDLSELEQKGEAAGLSV